MYQLFRVLITGNIKTRPGTIWRLTTVVECLKSNTPAVIVEAELFVRLVVFYDLLTNAYICTCISVKIGYQGVNFIISACIGRKPQLHDNSTQVIFIENYFVHSWFYGSIWFYKSTVLCKISKIQNSKGQTFVVFSLRKQLLKILVVF